MKFVCIFTRSNFGQEVDFEIFNHILIKSGGIIMKVIFTDGTTGTLSEEENRGLYVKGRFTLESWQELKSTMNKQAVISFQDQFLKKFTNNLIDIEYVNNQINTHK